MKILIIGRGGREHALAWKLRQSSKIDKIYCAPGNGGTSLVAENIPIPCKDKECLRKFILEKAIDLVIIGPENPLCEGLVDYLEEKEIKVFGPNASCALFEKSKKFTKEFLEKYEIPTARYSAYDRYDEALEALALFGYPLVIKADGLCQGKGVFVCDNFSEARRTLEKIFIEKVFGERIREVIIEEFLEGYELSLLCFVSKNKLFPMDSAKDHKQIFDGGRGPNTSGIGAYSPGPEPNELLRNNIRIILKKIEEAFDEEKLLYHGILFIGFMINNDYPKVLEFNVRFGDPEAEVLLPRLEGDFVEIIEKTLKGQLEFSDLIWKKEYSLTTVLVSGGYPKNYEIGKKIKGLDQLDEDILVFHNGTLRKNNEFFTDGGRVLSITAMGRSLEEARKKVYDNITKINFDNMYYRKDIGLT
ncbi:MAG: phosphoribosylamine--glycine ligase [Tissierellia bacterium]|nr:phosphoribosylamine--glycine ligase [Tissierellia bacterium]